MLFCSFWKRLVCDCIKDRFDRVEASSLSESSFLFLAPTINESRKKKTKIGTKEFGEIEKKRKMTKLFSGCTKKCIMTNVTLL